MTPTGGFPMARPVRMPSGKKRFDAVEGAKNQSTDAEPNRQGYPGARNFSGASRNETASTMPSQTNMRPTAVAEPRFMTSPHAA